MSAREAFGALATHALAEVVTHARRLCDADDADGVHQVRVALRRLRGAIALFKPVVADSAVHAIKARLKALADDLAPAREIDVLLSGAYARADWRGEDSAVRVGFGRRLSAARTAAYVRARRAVQEEPLRGLATDVLAWIESGPWTGPDAPRAAVRDRPAAALAARALDRCRRRALRHPARFGRLPPDARHALRITIKTLRLAAETFSPLFPAHPRRRRRFLARTKALLDDLGDLNDVVAVDRITLGPLPSPITAWASDRERAVARAAAGSWSRFRRAKRFW